MKSKKLLFSSILSLGCIATYLIFTSSATAVQGVMGASQTGCGSCHGASANAATSIAVTGIPAAGYVAGTTYLLSVTVTNGTKLAAGFDMTVTGGTMSLPPANTMLMGGTELHHTAPLNMTGGVSTWNFSWTAPATNTVTFHVAGNAVNSNGGDSGDQWNKVSLVFNKAVPASVEEVEKISILIYPNPATSTVTIKSTNEINVNSLTVIAINGTMITPTVTKINTNEYRMDTQSLPKGNYILSHLANGKRNLTRFIVE